MIRKTTTPSSSPSRHTQLARVAVHSVSPTREVQNDVSTYRVVHTKNGHFLKACLIIPDELIFYFSVSHGA